MLKFIGVQARSRHNKVYLIHKYTIYILNDIYAYTCIEKHMNTVLPGKNNKNVAFLCNKKYKRTVQEKPKISLILDIKTALLKIFGV